MNDAITLLSTPPPKFSESDAANILLDQFGITGSLKVLESERDQNFLVEPETGDSYVFKIVNAAEAAGVADFQIEALLHIEKKAPDLLVPRVVPGINGSTRFTTVDDEGRQHITRVLTWLEGIPLSMAEPKPDNAAERGSFLARLGVALADFEHSSSDHVLLWDLSHAEQLATLLDHIEDGKQREICRGRLQKFEEHTKPAMTNLRSQVIYNDLHSDNLLVDPDNPETITGIIDFGDMVKSPLVVDVAVAAAYLCEEGEDPLSGMVSFLGGYCQTRPLLAEEVELLYELIILRNVVTVIISHWRAAQFPENIEYILGSVQNAKSAIDTMIALGQNKVTDILSKACNP
jgi:Ser/Thr protein kinase RdoA (MazF antagonist)